VAARGGDCASRESWSVGFRRSIWRPRLVLTARNHHLYGKAFLTSSSQRAAPRLIVRRRPSWKARNGGVLRRLVGGPFIRELNYPLDSSEPRGSVAVFDRDPGGWVPARAVDYYKLTISGRRGYTTRRVPLATRAGRGARRSQFRSGLSMLGVHDDRRRPPARRGCLRVACARRSDSPNSCCCWRRSRAARRAAFANQISFDISRHIKRHVLVQFARPRRFAVVRLALAWLGSAAACAPSPSPESVRARVLALIPLSPVFEYSGHLQTLPGGRIKGR